MRGRSLVASALVVLAACGTGDTDPDPPAATVATPVPVAEVHTGVEFYPACGNEVLEHAGVTWYQVHADEYPEVWAAVDVARAEPASPVGFRAVPRVAPPGPGDDVGTLVVWVDGVARFVSDSDDLDAWLVDDELSYRWVC